VIELDDSRLLGGRGTELLRSACSKLVRAFAEAKYELPPTMAQTQALSRLAGASDTTKARTARSISLDLIRLTSPISWGTSRSA